MRRIRWRTAWPVALGLALVILALVWTFALPRLADHNGFALPRACGVPARINYEGRHYANEPRCAGGSTTHGCYTEADLQALGAWPLARVGSVPTLLGDAHPIALPTDAEAIPAGVVPTTVYVEDNSSCYLEYSLEGGP